MQPIKSLLNKIKWGKRENPGEYSIYYLDRISKKLIKINYIDIKRFEDNFIIVENDLLESPFSSRVIKIDSYGNILWSFGEGYIVNTRDARPLLNGDIIISC